MKIKQLEVGQTIQAMFEKYSDVRCVGLFKVLTAFHINRMAREWRRNDSPEPYLNWLVEQCYLEPVQYRTIHFGEWRDIKITE